MSEVIHEEEHKLILADEEGILRRAGIHRNFLHQSAVPYISERDLDWIQRFKVLRADGICGAAMWGPQKIQPAHKMQAMTGALLRNYIDGRVITLTTVLDMIEEGDHLDCTCLMIPNFYVRMEGRVLPAWQTAKLYDLLLRREAEGLMTVVYVEDGTKMRHEYGSAMDAFVSCFHSIGD